MNAPAALRRAANTVEACAISDATDALIVLLARAMERKALGTLCEDEAEALVSLLASPAGFEPATSEIEAP